MSRPQKMGKLWGAWVAVVFGLVVSSAWGGNDYYALMVKSTHNDNTSRNAQRDMWGFMGYSTLMSADGKNFYNFVEDVCLKGEVTTDTSFINEARSRGILKQNEEFTNDNMVMQEDLGTLIYKLMPYAEKTSIVTTGEVQRGNRIVFIMMELNDEGWTFVEDNYGNEPIRGFYDRGLGTTYNRWSERADRNNVIWQFESNIDSATYLSPTGKQLQPARWTLVTIFNEKENIERPIAINQQQMDSSDSLKSLDDCIHARQAVLPGRILAGQYILRFAVSGNSACVSLREALNRVPDVDGILDRSRMHLQHLKKRPVSYNLPNSFDLVRIVITDAALNKKGEQNFREQLCEMKKLPADIPAFCNSLVKTHPDQDQNYLEPLQTLAESHSECVAFLETSNVSGALKDPLCDTAIEKQRSEGTDTTDGGDSQEYTGTRMDTRSERMGGTVTKKRKEKKKKGKRARRM